VERSERVVAVAGIVQRLAVLLGAGVPPASAWSYLADDASPVPRAVASAPSVSDALLELSSAMPPIEARAWRGLAAAWSVATGAGAPLAGSLRAYAQSLRALAQAQRDAATALAGPVATARMVMALPAVGLVFGLALGFDTIGVLTGTPIGWACLAIGLGLVFAGSRWNRSLVRAAQPTRSTPGLECELLAIAMAGGAPLAQALETVGTVLIRCGLDADLGRAHGILELSRRAGVPAAELLRSEADEARADARSEAQLAAARLATRLMLPLGLCVLPAFMVLSVVALLVRVISTTVLEF
jgi:tight adherence protein B